MPVTNELGNTYGRLTVIAKEKSINGKARWLCQCSCGNTVIVSGDCLRRSNGIRSCGCLQKEIVSKSSLINLVGKKFGLLTVIKLEAHGAKSIQPKWKCLCDCGNIVTVDGNNLTSGNTKSCGCLKESYGILKIKQFLQEQNLPYELEKQIKAENKTLYVDIFVNNKYGIEFDGIQHFKHSSGWRTQQSVQNTHERDLIKNRWFFSQNIPLIRIPYTKAQTLQVSDLLLTSSSMILTPENESYYYNKYYQGDGTYDIGKKEKRYFSTI